MAIKPDTPAAPAGTDGAQEPDSVVSLGKDVADNAKRLARLEVELVKAQAVASLKSVAVGMALVVVALLCLLYVVTFGLGAAAVTIGGALPWLVIMGVFLLLTIILGIVAATLVKRAIAGGKSTADDVKNDVSGTLNTVKSRRWRG